ncbi:unnamed protein product [Rotaria sp. Silwood2]|nr:unnamed protein product [Rotaria sp. Silwood2]
MDDTNDYEKSDLDTPDDAALYLECIRLVEGGHVRRFENSANKFDLIRYELNDGVSKPLLFYAIEHNDEAFVKILLDMEVPLDKKYSLTYNEIFNQQKEKDHKLSMMFVLTFRNL